MQNIDDVRTELVVTKDDVNDLRKIQRATGLSRILIIIQYNLYRTD